MTGARKEHWMKRAGLGRRKYSGRELEAFGMKLDRPSSIGH